MNKFGNEIEIRQLINQYKGHDCLWDIYSPNYKDKSLKQAAWEEIANFFQKSPNEVKRKMQYLRAAYVHEKRRVEASKKSDPEAPHEPMLFYYKEMDFLDNMVIWRKFENGKNESDAPLTDFENKEFVAFENSQDDYLQEPELTCKIEALDESDLKPVPTPKLVNTTPVSPPVQLPSTARKRNDIKRVEPNEECPNTSKSQRNLLYSSFGRTIALQLQQMPLEDALLAMSEIQNIITMKSLEHIRTLQNGYGTCSESDNDNDYYNDVF